MDSTTSDTKLHQTLIRETQVVPHTKVKTGGAMKSSVYEAFNDAFLSPKQRNMNVIGSQTSDITHFHNRSDTITSLQETERGYSIANR